MDKSGPAFLMPGSMRDGDRGARGMTLRDYFAAMSLTGIATSLNTPKSTEQAAEWAYQLADAMLSARETSDRPKVVCLCGSTRFMEAWQAANLRETLAGRIVLSIGCNTKSDADLQRLGTLTPEKKAELDELHKRKIDLADEILVLNVGGYIGESTLSEIQYAKLNDKPVRYLES